MTVIARFWVQSVTKHATGNTSVVLAPVVRATGLPGAAEADAANKSWSKYTPSGKIELNVSQETRAGQWFDERLGKDVAITFEDPDDPSTE